MYAGVLNNIVELENVDKTNEGKQLIANAITDMGVPTFGTDSFATMGQNIRNIKSNIRYNFNDELDPAYGYNGPRYTLKRDTKVVVACTSATKSATCTLMFLDILNGIAYNIRYSTSSGSGTNGKLYTTFKSGDTISLAYGSYTYSSRLLYFDWSSSTHVEVMESPYL